MAKGKTTTGNADALFSSSTSKAADQTEEKSGGEASEGTESPRQRITTDIDRDIINRARNIVWAESGVSLAAMITEGLELVVSEWEKHHGGPYPERPQEHKRLPKGRPPTK